mmetsp:Transcript_157832/g.506222  ORF Transcript_157832/g.506222 Transcript_157832/m.506222 type:complete len:324 (-) Transcript_157832:1076-2047(-)
MRRAKSDATFVAAPLSRLVAHSYSSLEPPSSGFMERLSFPAPTSTPVTRTWTSWPTSSSSATFSTKPSLICVTCTKPCATASLPGTGTSTKAPKDCVFTTLPVSHWDDSRSSNGDKSTCSREEPRLRPPSPPDSSGFMERLSFPAPTSTPVTRTWTSWPTSSSSATFSTKPSLICVTCTKPCATASLPGTGTSTKAPNDCVFTTLPVSHWDDSRSSNGDKFTCSREEPRLRPPSPPDSFMEQLILLRSSSTLMMRTLISWPISTTSSGLSQKPSWSWETCTKASATSPPGSVTTTNAPKGMTFATWASTQPPESTNAWKGSQL